MDRVIADTRPRARCSSGDMRGTHVEWHSELVFPGGHISCVNGSNSEKWLTEVKEVSKSQTHQLSWLALRGSVMRCPEPQFLVKGAESW